MDTINNQYDPATHGLNKMVKVIDGRVGVVVTVFEEGNEWLKATISFGGDIIEKHDVLGLKLYITDKEGA